MNASQTPPTLVLMRHAKSSWNSDARSDFERPLSRRGRRDAPAMGRWLAQQLPQSPDRLLSSPALRAWQTCEAVMAASGWPGCQPQWEDDIYGAGARCLLGLIRQVDADCRTVMLIGHNPAIDDLVNHLLPETPPLTPKGKLMTTAAVAILHPQRDWSDLKAGCASLEVLMRPRELAAELVGD